MKEVPWRAQAVANSSSTLKTKGGTAWPVEAKLIYRKEIKCKYKWGHWGGWKKSLRTTKSTPRARTESFDSEVSNSIRRLAASKPSSEASKKIKRSKDSAKRGCLVTYSQNNQLVQQLSNIPDGTIRVSHLIQVCIQGSTTFFDKDIVSVVHNALFRENGQNSSRKNGRQTLVQPFEIRETPPNRQRRTGKLGKYQYIYKMEFNCTILVQYTSGNEK